MSYNDPCNFKGYGPSMISDDLGSYFIIPKIVEFFGLSLDASIQLLYTGSVILAFIAGALGSWFYCKTTLGKLISILALALLSAVMAGIGDYYIFMGVVPMAFIPWYLYLEDRGKVKASFVYFAIMGLLIGSAHLIRSHSGTSVLIFVSLSLLLTKQYSKKVKLAFVVIILMGMSMVFTGFDKVMEQRVAFLKSIDSPHDPEGIRARWHNLYYSLGYLYNFHAFEGWTDGPGHEPSDTYSVRKALSIKPDVILYSSDYEELLKTEYFKFVKNHPFFIIQTFFAKFGVLLMYVLLFMNVGLILSFYYLKSFKFLFFFCTGIGFNMLFGLLATPEYQYLMGLFAFATMYGTYSIDYAIERGVLKRLNFN